MVERKGELRVSIGFAPFYEVKKKGEPIATGPIRAGENLVIRGFTCTMEGAELAAKYSFYVIPQAEERRLDILPAMVMGGTTPLEPEPFIHEGKEYFTYRPDFNDVAMALRGYTLSQEEAAKVDAFFRYPPEPVPETLAPEALEYFAALLKKILEGAGYTVAELEKTYFPAPTSAALIAPVFSLGLQKEVEAIDRQEAYEITLTYLTYEKPLSKTQIQLRLLDNIPEERLQELQRRFKDALSPRGLKTLYLVMEECGENKRTPWFNLDTNRALDLMGYKRNKKGVHEPRNKERFLQELDDLTRINFNVEKRLPKKGKKDQSLKFEAPLISITGKFELYEVDHDRPIEEGVKIAEGKQIFIHPEIYKFIGSYYTFIPHEFLKIDVGRTPHAGFLYAYIANQWRIGWSQYQGTIKQPIKQILDGAGLLDNYYRKKRRNKQRDFIEDVKDALRTLKENPAFWIKSLHFDTENKAPLEQIVTIEMAEDHPLKTAMKGQIEES